MCYKYHLQNVKPNDNVSTGVELGVTETGCCYSFLFNFTWRTVFLFYVLLFHRSGSSALLVK